jgi:hypothetical protein
MNLATPQQLSTSAVLGAGGVDAAIKSGSTRKFYEPDSVVSYPDFQQPHPAMDELQGFSAQEIVDLSDGFLFGKQDEEEIDALMTAPILEASYNVSPIDMQLGQIPMMSHGAYHSIPPSPPPSPSHQSPKKRQSSLQRSESNKRFRTYQSGNWAQRFEELCEYRETHGNCLISHAFAENLPLARWVKRQRYQYKLMLAGQPSTMIPARVRALEEIGFCWGSQESAWNERFEELLDFKAQTGHCNVPSLFADNPQLATWVKCQRRQYKLFKSEGSQSNITLQRVIKLEQTGFEWELKNSKKAR